jgi:hypothetical protein
MKRPDWEGNVRPGEEGAKLGARYGTPAAHEESDRSEDVESAERRDEGWKPNVGDQNSVDEAGACSDAESDQERKPPWETDMSGERSDDHGYKDHNCADRQIDACGQNNERLTDRQ